jgi:deoxyribodipyrimidine photolyase-related protein
MAQKVGPRLGSGQILFREMSKNMIKRCIYVPFDQLNVEYGALKSANSKTDVILLVENQSMLQNRNWHPERIYFLVSSARNFAQSLKDLGFAVRYEQLANVAAGVEKIKSEFGEVEFLATAPSSFAQVNRLTDLNIRFVDNDFFLTTRADFDAWASSQKSYRMENFYRKQRVRLDILMEGSEPVGGRWNFDAENRLPPPKNYTWAPYLEHTTNEIDQQVAQELDHSPSRTWATTRDGALAQLNYFLDHNFADFGPLEDAVPSDNWAVHHSLLSPYLNSGLLHPSEVIAAALNKYDTGGIPLESCEAFIRQIIGWREYVNGMYWFLGEDYRERNGLGANRKLLPLFNDSTVTAMACVSASVSDVDERSWIHHIPRLMILSNLALIAGVNPQEFLDWMRERFIDAADWVMVPNVIGMGVHADGGLMMTKPYAAGGAYISRMTQYCKGCVYDPKKRTGATACPFTTLYWDFLDRHRSEFSKNHRMSQQVRGLDRLADLDELRVRASEVLNGLDSGTI